MIIENKQDTVGQIASVVNSKTNRVQHFESFALPSRVEVEFGRGERFVFNRSNPGTWRLVWHSMFGRSTGMHGVGCDATGFVIDDKAIIDRLNHLLRFSKQMYS